VDIGCMDESYHIYLFTRSEVELSDKEVQRPTTSYSARD